MSPSRQNGQILDNPCALLFKSQDKGPLQCLIPVILATREGGRGFHFEASPGKKVSESTISTNKPDIVVHACHPSYVTGIDRRIIVRGQPQAKTQEPI
jgi:hypothetical protein